MIQFNLLPDVKVQFLAARRNKRLVIAFCVIASTVSLAIFLTLMLITVAQKKHIANVDKDIQTSLANINARPDVSKVLTIQNQLKSLPALHDQKPVSSRLFAYLSQLTPSEATISELEMDYTDNSISITGTSKSNTASKNNLQVVNKFVDTLKFTKYKVGDDGEPALAFKDVVLASFGRDEKQSTYQIDFKFDPMIFNSQMKVALIVPETVTTRSVTEKPLFEKAPEPVRPTERGR